MAAGKLRLLPDDSLHPTRQDDIDGFVDTLIRRVDPHIDSSRRVEPVVAQGPQRTGAIADIEAPIRHLFAGALVVGGQCSGLCGGHEKLIGGSGSPRGMLVAWKP
jgi:hypothetical protein